MSSFAASNDQIKEEYGKKEAFKEEYKRHRE